MERRIAGRREVDGFTDFRLELPEHCGTHLDAPLHFAQHGMPVHEIPAAALCGQLCLLDIQHRAHLDPDTSVTSDDIRSWESRHGPIPPGSVVLMRSGWSNKWPDADAYFGRASDGAFHAPGWSVHAVDYLLNARTVSGIGVDTCSIDPLSATTFPVHRLWLGAGKWALENIANLESVPESGGWIVAGVPKISGATGFPARVFAFVREEGKHEED